MKLETRHLDVGYQKKVLIGDINIELEGGRITTIIGPNGSGKSTILRTIAGQLQKQGGTILLNEADTEDLTGLEIARQLAVVMTERIDPERMTCREVVAGGRYPYTGRLGILSGEDRQVVDWAIREVEAESVADRSFDQISDGQRQRIMLARALAQTGEVLLLDEPTSYLDMKYKISLLQVIRAQAAERGIAVLMSLHELDLAAKISDQLICVDGQKIDRVGTPEQIFAGDYIQKLYGVAEECFDPVSGMVQLPRTGRKAECFVLCGGGGAAAGFYALQRAGIAFVAGIIPENDVDYFSARATAAEVLETAAFEEPEPSVVSQAKRYIDECSSCICLVKTFGTYNAYQRILCDYAKQQGKLKALREIIRTY